MAICHASARALGLCAERKPRCFACADPSLRSEPALERSEGMTCAKSRGNTRTRKERGSRNAERGERMKKKWILDKAVTHAIEETWAAFSAEGDTHNPALFLVRLADLARSNAFLW